MKNFLTDQNGLSQRDFLLVSSTAIFFGFLSVGLVLILIGKEINPMYIELLDMVSIPFTAIVSGLFGVSMVEKFRNKNEAKNDDEVDYNDRV